MNTFVTRLFLLCLLFALVSCSKEAQDEVSLAESATPAPWLELKTTNSRYRLRIEDSYEQVPAGTLHFWDIHVMTIDEQPLTPQRLKVSGTMPGHGHGMATFPKARSMNREGLMRVKGMKFHMGGEWRMRIDINDSKGPDYAYFNFNVEPAPVSLSSNVTFTDKELAQLKALRLNALPPLDKDPSNRLSQNSEAAELGEALFFDKGLSRSGTVSCATCHDPTLGFADGKTLSVGTATTPRHAPALLDVARSTWFYWDGRRDSLWAQALSPIETEGEMDNTRGDALRYIVSHPEHGPVFKQLTGFGKELLDVLTIEGIGPYSTREGKQAWDRLRPPEKERMNTAFSFIGKALAAYEETLQHSPSRFDEFVNTLLDHGEKRASEIFSGAEMRGAKLYANEEKTPCLRCHNGALFTNQEFHNIDTGMNTAGEFDAGRANGVSAAKRDPFNCLGVFSDALPEQCVALTFGRGNHLDSGAFKTPTLRNVVNTAPYFHDGRFATLELVVAHYLASEGIAEDTHEMPKFTLTGKETSDLIAFLKTL